MSPCRATTTANGLDVVAVFDARASIQEASECQHIYTVVHGTRMRLAGNASRHASEIFAISLKQKQNCPCLFELGLIGGSPPNKAPHDSPFTKESLLPGSMLLSTCHQSGVAKPRKKHSKKFDSVAWMSLHLSLQVRGTRARLKPAFENTQAMQH